MTNDRPRILFADDQAEMRELVRRALAPHFDVEAVCDGDAALAEIEQRAPDLVLSDIAMPGVNGFELVRALREDPRYRTIPVILLTGNESEETVIEGLRAGADELMAKPCSMRMLIARIAGHIERARMRCESERHVREISEMLMRSNQELEQFAFIVTHDLQEPLRKIMAQVDGLAARLQTEDAGEIVRLRASAMRMKTVIDDVLSLARLSEGLPALERIDLRPLLDEITSDLEIKISESGAEIRLRESDLFYANRAQMCHLLQNLITNSIKFARKGVPPRVVIDCRAAGTEAEILFSDNGVGFDNRHADRIFKPFERLHSRKDYEGTGIGLAIVEKIVRNHGGRIQVQSVAGQGTTFVITLPQPA